jgi:AcrR family transcriptional regulator
VSRPAGMRLPAAERRSAVVAAALEVFGSGSYAGSTTAEIARAAGVSEPIIYRHFPSKRDLWCACVEQAWLQLQETLDRKAAILSGHGSLDDIAGNRSPWADPVLPTLWIQGLTEAADDEEIQRFLRAHVREVHDYVAAGMGRMQESGVIVADRDPGAEAWILLAGGLLRSFADRLGGVVRPGELAAVGRERRRWLTGA